MLTVSEPATLSPLGRLYPLRDACGIHLWPTSAGVAWKNPPGAAGWWCAHTGYQQWFVVHQIFDFRGGPGRQPGGRFSWPRALFAGEISGVGGAALGFTFRDAEGRELNSAAPQAKDASNKDPMTLLENAVCGPGMPPIDAVGYRVVHPGPLLHQHQRITDEVLKDLEQAVAFAPLHDPEAIRLDPRHDGEISPGAALCMLRHHLPPDHAGRSFDLRHTQRVSPAGCAPIWVPWAFLRRRGGRYAGRLQTGRKTQFPRRMVIAHLGSGCSVTALVDGRSVDNTMGLTPTGGVVMGTRPGDLDPGLVLYLLRQAKGDRDAA